jgi:hypothetical protein
MGPFFRASALLSIMLSICSLFLCATPAAAELTFSFEVSGKYEDNVTGVARDNPNIGADTRHGGGATVGGVHLKGGLDDILSGGTGTAAQTGKQGDFSTTLYADIGTHHDLSDKTSLLLLLSVDHTAYNKFADLDFTIGTAIVGLGHRFSEGFSGRIEASAALRDVKLAGADSMVYGLTASLKERVGEAVWLRESATIEQSKADNSINDYTGTDLSLRAGYDFSSSHSLSAGYSYLLRDFKNSPVGVQTSVQAASLDWSMDLSDRWSILAGYDHEWIKVKTDLASGTADNNVYSAAVRYDF